MSIVFNLLIIILVIISIWRDTKKAPLKVLFRYFTIQSNALCAISSAVVLFGRISGKMGYFAYGLKYMGTVAVMVTFLTVVLFLGPTQKNYDVLLTGPELHLHLTVPLLALVSYLVRDKMYMPFGCVILGVLPVILYGILYLKKVVFTEGDDRWEDFYGFNAGGRWAISFTAMLVATFILSSVMIIL